VLKWLIHSYTLYIQYIQVMEALQTLTGYMVITN